MYRLAVVWLVARRCYTQVQESRTLQVGPHYKHHKTGTSVPEARWVWDSESHIALVDICTASTALWASGQRPPTALRALLLPLFLLAQLCLDIAAPPMAA